MKQTISIDVDVPPGEKHCNEMANKKDAQIASLQELARDWSNAFETSNVRTVPELKERTRKLAP